MKFRWHGNQKLSKCRLENGDLAGFIRRTAQGYGFVAFGCVRPSDGLSERLGAALRKDKAKKMVTGWYIDRCAKQEWEKKNASQVA